MLPHLRPRSPPGDPEAPKVSRRSPATSASPPHACRRYRKRFSLPPLVAVTDSSSMRGLIVTLHGVLRGRSWCRWNMTSGHIACHLLLKGVIHKAEVYRSMNVGRTHDLIATDIGSCNDHHQDLDLPPV